MRDFALISARTEANGSGRDLVDLVGLDEIFERIGAASTLA
jgi:hypothetical protein